MKVTKGITIIFFLSIGICYPSQKIGVCKVPVADLYGQPISSLSSWLKPLNNTIPLCSAEHNELCPRIHQLLYNQMVVIKETLPEEYKISIQDFYRLPNGQCCYDYYCNKNNIALVDSHTDVLQIPGYSTNPTVVLTKPWYDEKTGQTYSAGTCFVLKNKNKNFTIYNYSYHQKRWLESTIPSHKGLLVEKRTPDQARELFIKILRSWIKLTTFIPYVWGGCSYGQECKGDFSIQKVTIHTTPYSYYQRADSRGNPHTGFDCAGLIVRAAQIAGIPYHYKNTNTLAHFLQPLTPDYQLQEGDLIWFSGHVMIISNKEKNLIIEARSYGHGFGKVHELPICQVFNNIATLDDLVNAYYEHRPLVRINHHHQAVQTINSFKILRLASVWSSPCPHALQNK